VIAIQRRAAELGFAATGVARLDRNPHAAELDQCSPPATPAR